MTVIKGNKTYFVRPGSANASDTETLNLGNSSASDNESLHDETTEARTQLFRRLPLRQVIEEPIYFRKSFGRKKLRRYQNRCVLQTLREDDEMENALEIMESYRGPFSRLLENSEAMKYWNDFIEKSEDEQADIINTFTNKCNKKSDCCLDSNVLPLGWISSKTRKQFKAKKNLSIETVKGCEDAMLEFFNSTPNDVYTKSPPSSFHRLILRAIARYHGLQIKVIKPLNRDERPSMEIFNTKENWIPANCFLTDFIQQLK